MSRYNLTPFDPALEVVVGWDGPLRTYFLQVFDSRLPTEQAACLHWVGNSLEDLTTVGALQEALVAWALLPSALGERLAMEQASSPPPTPLQQWAAGLGRPGIGGWYA